MTRTVVALTIVTTDRKVVLITAVTHIGTFIIQRCIQRRGRAEKKNVYT